MSQFGGYTIPGGLPQSDGSVVVITPPAVSGDVLTATSATTADWAPAGGAVNTFNVRTYGATGNGTTDDTTAVQAAITAAAAAPGGTVFFPPGTYLVTGLTLPGGTVLQGVNAQGYAYDGGGFFTPNTNTLSRLLLKSGSTSPILAPYDGGAHYSMHVHINDLDLDCNGIGFASGVGIHLPDNAYGYPRFWIMRNLYIHNVGADSGNAYGVYIGEGDEACQMWNCVVFNGESGSAAGDNGIGWYGSDGLMVGSGIGDFGTYGLLYLGGSSDETLTVIGGGIFGCGFANVGVAGSGLTVIGTSIDHAAEQAVYIADGQTTFVSCEFGSNGLKTNNTYPIIALAANNLQVNVVGCRIPAGSGNIPTYFVAVGSSTGCVINGLESTQVGSGSLGTGLTDYTFGVTAAANAVTVPVGRPRVVVQNNAAGALAITLTTTNAAPQQPLVVQILDHSAATQTLSWVNTENSTVSAPTTSNGSTTLPLTVGFVYNASTSKWRCVAVA